MAALSSTTALAARMPARRAAGKRLSVQAKVAGTNARVARSSKSDIIVSPSILSANFSKLGEEVRTQLPLPFAQTCSSISHLMSLALVFPLLHCSSVPRKYKRRHERFITPIPTGPLCRHIHAAKLYD
jgi:hypothetical protein